MTEFKMREHYQHLCELDADLANEIDTNADERVKKTYLLLMQQSLHSLMTILAVLAGDSGVRL